MIKSVKSILALSLLVSLNLAGCGADSGGDRAAGVEPGPPPSGGNPTPPPTEPPPSDGVVDVGDISEGDSVNVDIVGVGFNSPATITFNVLVNDTDRVEGFSSSNARFALVQMVPNAGDSAGTSWSSYINTSEDPICRSQADIDNSSNACTSFTEETDPSMIPDTARKVQDPVAIGKVVTTQATTENSGTFSDNADGTWSYTFSTDIPDAETLTNVHRVCIQYSLNVSVPNMCVDFVPADVITAGDGSTGTSLDDEFYGMYSARQIVTEESCNTCHDQVAFHGGGRTQMDYCVTCHNPGTTDANSGNSVDFKQMIHKIHWGRSLPNLEDGIAYKIWGFNNGEHDYSKTSYPQSVMTCARCHAGDEDIEFSEVQGTPLPLATLTNDGHNWVSAPTKDSCESCHEKLFTDNLKIDGTVPSTDHTSYTEERNCAGCHRDRGADEPGGLQANQAHRDFADEMGRHMSMAVESIESVGAGESPKVVFSISDADGNKLDLHDPADMCGEARFDIRMPMDAATDYRMRISASGSPADLVAEGDNNFSYTLSDVVADDVNTIAAMLDFNFPYVCGDSESGVVRLDAVIQYAASSSEMATARRMVVDVAKCNDCHDRFLLTSQYHSGTRAVNSPEACMACHNSEFATSDRTREMGTMIHGIHASAIRENPHKDWDTDKLQYPGNIADCTSCHADGTYLLPLSLTREPIKYTSDGYTTAIASECSGCHDSALAKSHMESAGGALFNVDFDSAAAVTESCDVCHGTGKSADVDVVHQR